MTESSNLQHNEVAGNQTNLDTNSGQVLSGTFQGPVTINITNQVEARLAETINAGLESIHERIQNPLIYAALVTGREQFTLAIVRLNELSCYKWLHDQFHQLEDKVRVLDDYREDFERNPAIWRRVTQFESDIYEAVGILIQAAEQSQPFIGSPLWISKLRRGQGELRNGVDQQSAVVCTQGLARLDGVLGSVPGELNVRLREVARHLPLVQVRQQLEQAMPAIQGNELHMQRVEESIVALQQLAERITRLVADHDAFQEIDKELRVFNNDFSQLADSWPMISEYQQRICSVNQAEWAISLMKLVSEIERYLAESNRRELEKSFWRYQSQMKRTFSTTDHDLLACCSTLQQIAPKLELIFQAVI